MANEYRISTFSVEILRDGIPPARVSTFAVEALRDGNGNARVSTHSIEALHNGAAKARVSTFAIEVLRSVLSQTGQRAFKAPHSTFWPEEEMFIQPSARMRFAYVSTRRRPVLFYVG
jgi:hypothetical protein